MQNERNEQKATTKVGAQPVPKKTRQNYSASISLTGKILQWTIHPTLAWPDEEEALVITFHGDGKYKKEEQAHQELIEILKQNGIHWLTRHGKKWFFDVETMRPYFKRPPELPWLKGLFEVVGAVKAEKDGVIR